MSKHISKPIKTIERLYHQFSLNLGIKGFLKKVIPDKLIKKIQSFSVNTQDLNSHHFTFRPRSETSYVPKKNFIQFSKLFDLEIEKIKREVKKDKRKYIGLQTPEGMKKFVSELATYLENELNKKIVVSSEPCFGACDIKHHQFESIGIKTIIHLGNAAIPNVKLPSETNIIFIPLYIKIPIKPTTKKAIKYLKKHNISKVGIVSSISFIKNVNKIKKQLEASGIEVYMTKGNKRLSMPAHVLGCNASSAIPIKNKVEIFIMFEDGSFHAPAVSLTTHKDVVCFDPVSEKTIRYSYNKLKKHSVEKRKINHQKLQKAKKVGLIISNKIGQNRSSIIYRIEKMYSKKGYSTTILISDYIDPNSFNPTDFDMFIASMCPRISHDERLLFSKPILTIPEALEFINKERISNKKYTFDQFS